MSAQVVAWRAEYVKIQEEAQDPGAGSSRRDVQEDARPVAADQDEESKINKTLNDEASRSSPSSTTRSRPWSTRPPR